MKDTTEFDWYFRAPGGVQGAIHMRCKLIHSSSRCCGRRRTRASIDGPTVTLEPTGAQTAAILLHELATGAAKYGSLSAPGAASNSHGPLQRAAGSA
jgi:hypothetical protein